jgi:hypothetical protein
MAAPADERVAVWSVRPPDLMASAIKHGKKEVCQLANAVGMSGVVQKHSAATGEFWAVLRADAPGNLAVLRTQLRERHFTVEPTPHAAAPAALLHELERKPVEVLPSADGIHSRGSSGARDNGEIPPTQDEEERLTVGSAFDDAAGQATLAVRQLRRAEMVADKAGREAVEARAEAKAEREKGERERAVLAQAVEAEREKGERERAVLAQAVEAEREKSARERAASSAAILAAEVRAARAEATLAARARRGCSVV